MGAEWYYSKGGGQSGPVTDEELHRLARTGEIARTDMVWKQGMASWMVAGQIAGLYPPPMPVAGGPPPLPPVLDRQKTPSASADPEHQSPWPASERAAANPNLWWKKAGMIASIVVGCLFLLSIVGALFSLPFFSLAALIYMLAIREERLQGRWVPADGSGGWVELLSGSIFKREDGAVGTFAVLPNQMFVDMFLSGRLVDSWKMLSWGATTLEVQDHKGVVRGFTKGKTLEEKRTMPFQQDRIRHIVGVWDPIDGSGRWIQFTKDEAAVFSDGAAGRYSVTGEQPNEVIKVKMAGGTSREMRVLSLDKEQLVLAEGAATCTYRCLSRPETGVGSMVKALFGNPKGGKAPPPVPGPEKMHTYEVTLLPTAGFNDPAVAGRAAASRDAAQDSAVPAEKKPGHAGDDLPVFSGDGPCPNCKAVLWIEWRGSYLSMKCPRCGHVFDGEGAIAIASAYKPEKNYKADRAQAVLDEARAAEPAPRLLPAPVAPPSQASGAGGILSSAWNWWSGKALCADCQARNTELVGSTVVKAWRDVRGHWEPSNPGKLPQRVQLLHDCRIHEDHYRCKDCGKEWLVERESSSPV